MPDTEVVFSNPLPPSSHFNVASDDEHPLTNDDFRKLMMTPRIPRDAISSRGVAPSVRKPSTESYASAKQTPAADEDLSDAAALRKKKKSYYAQLKKEEEEREKELAKRYRDRAKERREGKDKEEPSKEELASTTADYRAVAPDAKIPEDYAERRKKVIQESKYLGGDMEHTHLVKGLDYALLEKVKAEITNKEREEEQMEIAVQSKAARDQDTANAADEIQCKTQMCRKIVKILLDPPKIDRNDLFIPGRMAYVVDLEDENAEFDIPTTLIRSKADCPSLESTTTLSNNDIVVNKLTQILSYLRQGKRDRKKKKNKAGLPSLSNEERMKAISMDIYGGLGSDNHISSKQSKDKKRSTDDSRHASKSGSEWASQKSSQGGKRSYFEKPAEDYGADDVARGLPTNANDLVMSINSRFGGGSWNITDDNMPGENQQPSREDERMKKLKNKNEIDSYAECYPGMMESADAIDDSDEEADYTKMDQGNKKGPVGRWDFDTQEEYSSYMSTREAMPKAAFQYGVKMSDGRKTRRAGVKDEKKELDKEWQQIQNIIKKRKGDSDGGPSTKRSM